MRVGGARNRSIKDSIADEDRRKLIEQWKLRLQKRPDIRRLVREMLEFYKLAARHLRRVWGIGKRIDEMLHDEEPFVKADLATVVYDPPSEFSRTSEQSARPLRWWEMEEGLEPTMDALAEFCTMSELEIMEGELMTPEQRKAKYEERMRRMAGKVGTIYWLKKGERIWD